MGRPGHRGDLVPADRSLKNGSHGSCTWTGVGSDWMVGEVSGFNTVELGVTATWIVAWLGPDVGVML